MNAVVYCRVSSKEQIEGTSLESQQAACREYAQSKNIEISRVFIEQGESAKFADRTQLLELIDFCRKNKGVVQVLLVWKVDRFARNVADHFSVKATLGKYGVRIVSVTEPIDTNPEGKLMETILAGFAQFDNDIRAMRTVQGMRRKLLEGIFPWGPPFGYKSSVVGDEKKTMPDLPDEAVFSLIKRAFAEFATGAFTQAQMGRRMESWGLAPPHGKSFAPQSLYQLFTNPFYAGILVDPWTREEVTGKHVPAVTPEVFARVQRIINGRSRSLAHQKVREEFPLRGFVRCRSCSRALTSAFSRGRNARYPYYLCCNRECLCRGKSLPSAPVHAEFTSFLDEIAPRRELLEEIGKRILELAERDGREHTAQRQREKKRVNQLEKETAELIRMRAQNLITNEEFLAQKKRLADQRIALGSRPRGMPDIAQVLADLQGILLPLTMLRTTWNSLRLPLQLRFDHLVLPSGFVPGAIRTAPLGLLFKLFCDPSGTNSSGVPPTSLPLNRIISEIHEFSEIIRDTECTNSEFPIAV